MTFALLIESLPAGAASRVRPVVAAGVALFVAWQLTGRFDMRTPDPTVASGVSVSARPSMVEAAIAKLRTFATAPGAGPAGGLYDWMARFLPREALVATTVIDPYHIQRRTIQLLPVSQNRIDLSRPPQAILEEIRALGVTHLHLTQYSGLNVWMNPKVDEWLRSVRAIPALPGVELLVRMQVPSEKGEQAVYRLGSSRGARSGGEFAHTGDATPAIGFRATRFNSSQVLLRWEPDLDRCYGLSEWDSGARQFRPLGTAGAGQAAFLLPYAPPGPHRFRICRDDKGECSAPAYAEVERP